MLQEVGAQLQCASAAQGLHGQCALLLNNRAVGTKYQFLDGLVVRCQTVDRQIGTRRQFGGQFSLRFFHALQQRHLAVIVVIDADAEVGLARILVGIEGFGDAENRVAWRHFDGGEKGGRG